MANQQYQGQDSASEKLIFEQKITGVLNCDMLKMPSLFNLINQRASIAFHAYQQNANLSAMDRANVRGQILSIDAQIKNLMALD